MFTSREKHRAAFNKEKEIIMGNISGTLELMATLLRLKNVIENYP